MKNARLLILAALFSLVLCPSSARAQAQGGAVSAPLSVHALAMHGAPKYPADFTHLDYVNPDAPKGGILRLAAVGTFDNLNPYIIKGTTVAGAGLVFDTLLVSTDDEAFSEYGLLAESVEMPEDRSWVVFNLRPEARWHDGKPVTAEDLRAAGAMAVLRTWFFPSIPCWPRGIRFTEPITPM